MNKSEDVSKLFSMFGEKNTDQYQEIYEAEQNQASRERWPVFQRVQVDADRPVVSPPPASKPTQPTEKVPVVDARNESAPVVTPQPVVQADPSTTPSTPVSPKPMLRFPGTPAAAPVASPAPAPTIEQPSQPVLSGNLNTLFKRLEGQLEEEPVTPPEVVTAPAPEPVQGSIRSLFSRLSR